jgi:hypothetical protein
LDSGIYEFRDSGPQCYECFEHAKAIEIQWKADNDLAASQVNRLPRFSGKYANEFNKINAQTEDLEHEANLSNIIGDRVFGGADTVDKD